MTGQLVLAADLIFLLLNVGGRLDREDCANDLIVKVRSGSAQQDILVMNRKNLVIEGEALQDLANALVRQKVVDRAERGVIVQTQKLLPGAVCLPNGPMAVNGENTVL